MSIRPGAPQTQDGIIIDPLLASVSVPTTSTETINAFGTREIATLADLLSGLGQHVRAVEIVIRGAKWLGQVPDVASENDLGGTLDVNLRMRLAVAKLRLGETDTGKVRQIFV
jgi:hypothetical protein